MWCYDLMLRIGWTEKETNEEELQMRGLKKVVLLQLISNTKDRFITKE